MQSEKSGNEEKNTRLPLNIYNRWPIVLLVFLLYTGFNLSLFAEGSKELNSNSALSTKLYLCNDFNTHCNSINGLRSQFATYDDDQSAVDNDRLYFTILNSSEVVYMGFKGGTLGGNPARRIVYRIKEKITGNVVQAESNLPTTGTGFINTLAQAEAGPNQLIIPPNPQNGYDALVFTPPAPGTYYIEFTVRRNDNNVIHVGTFSVDIFDITVANTTTVTARPGRLHSKAWQFSEDNRFYSTNYIISDDSIVTSATFSNMQGGAWVHYCNQTGCGTTNWINDRKSLYHQQALYPQYKVFLNNPDPALFPSATTLGQIVNPQPWGEKFCETGHILFHITVDKPGNVELTMTFSGGFTTRVMNQPVVVGENLFDWDGLDGTTPAGVPVPNNTNITFTIQYINGLTNLPLYDVEGNVNGFTIALVAPPGSTPAVYWDDTNIPGGVNNSNPPGCLSPPGCHTWSGSGGGWGNLNTVNTWWYNVSTTTTPAIITEYRNPQQLAFIQSPPYVFCENTPNHFFSVTPDPNTDVYHWSFTPPAGVTINQATPASPSVTVSFGPGASSGFLTVYGENTNCAASGPTTTITVTLNPLPDPVIAGPLTPCIGSSGNAYTTQPGNSNYSWNISSGGTITSGGTETDPYVNVTWNMTGIQTVAVNYTENGCAAAMPSVYTVTVSELPIPVIGGDNSVCEGSAGHVYSTAAGHGNYTWTISAGGTIIAGGSPLDNTVTVTWNTAGAQTVSVGYTDGTTGCTSAAPTVFTVTVKPLPIPIITGNQDLCQGTTGVIYTTQTGNSGYVWTVSAGGTITAGGGSADNTVTVTWNTASAQTVSVNFADGITGCSAASPTIYPVTVKPLPVPDLNGPLAACVNNPGPVYSTEAGMSSYTWSISPPGAGTITSGTGTNSVEVTWNTTGNHTISINYISTNGCTAAIPTSRQVLVNSLPVPSLSGLTSICTGVATTYATEPGMQSYSWNISAGGTINAGGGNNDEFINVTWNTPGPKTVSINYVVGTGCTGAAPTVKTITVNQSTPMTITGLQAVCSGGTALYTTETGMTAYTWVISAGGAIVSGGGPGNNTVNIQWNTPGPQSVSVNFTNGFGCTAAQPTIYNVTVNPLPVTTITSATGPDCALHTKAFQTPPDPGSSFTWSVSPSSRGIVAVGQGTGNVTIDWLTAGAATIAVTGTNNTTGCQSSSTYPLTVNPSPNPSFTACFDLVTTTNARKFVIRGATPWVPSSGVFSGNRVSYNPATGHYEFDPQGAPAGSYPVTYTYTNTYGCDAIAPPVTITIQNYSVACGADLTDPRDGKKYKTALIGGKCWMKENLSYGTILADPQQPQTDNCLVEKYCLPADANCNHYGGLYQWDELMRYGATSYGQGICPPEWHVPTESEWQQLIDAIVTGVTPPADGIAGSFLKDAFLNPGFYALVEGFYYLNNTWEFNTGSLTGTMFWTSTPYGTDRTVARGVNTKNPSTARYNGSRGNAFSVRCVKD
jgi:uncharacterized protein (TIGR02145 family)